MDQSTPGCKKNKRPSRHNSCGSFSTNSDAIAGIDDGIDFTVEQNTGGVKTDFNGYTLTGVSTTNDLSPKLDSATQTAFLAVVAYLFYYWFKGLLNCSPFFLIPIIYN